METLRALKLTARQWATIDAQMDNSAQAARDSAYVDPDDDDEVPAPDALARAIRQAGWDQVPWVGPVCGWPPDEQVITVRLHSGQWAYAVEKLKENEVIIEQLGDDESLRLTRDAVAAIAEQLAGGKLRRGPVEVPDPVTSEMNCAMPRMARFGCTGYLLLMSTSDDVVRDIVRHGATLLPQVVAVVERCRTEPDPRQDLARACGALLAQYGQLRERLAELTPTTAVDHIDRIFYLQQRIVDEAAHLAFRPRSDRWARVARAFGDGLTDSADELLALAAQS